MVRLIVVYHIETWKPRWTKSVPENANEAQFSHVGTVPICLINNITVR
jgi:hypothetical protein